jgi:hypothetical protein
MIHAFQIYDQDYLNVMQSVCQLSNEEMAMLSYNIMKKLKTAQMQQEINPLFMNMRPDMPQMHPGAGYPISFYQNPGVDPNMNHMLFDNIGMNQHFPPFMPMPYPNYQYYMEQMQHNPQFYNQQKEKASRNAGQILDSSKKSAGNKKGQSDDHDDGSHTVDTKDNTYSKEKSSNNENSMGVPNISEMVRDLIEVSPYYLQDVNHMGQTAIGQELFGRDPVTGRKRRDEKNILKQAYGILAPKNPRQLNHAKILTKGRVTKYGNYRDIQLISYDDRVDSPN